MLDDNPREMKAAQAWLEKLLLDHKPMHNKPLANLITKGFARCFSCGAKGMENCPRPQDETCAREFHGGRRCGI
jgi:hypothetical protein